MRNPSEAEPHGAPLRKTPDVRSPVVMGVRPGSTRLCLGGAFAGVEVAYEECGHGVPVVCLHDAALGSREFRRIEREMPLGCRLITMDWPEHGRSSGWNTSTAGAIFSLDLWVEMVGAVLDALNLDRAVLLASGVAASVAIRFARRQPSRVRALMLCHPEGLVESGPAEVTSAARPFLRGRRISALPMARATVARRRAARWLRSVYAALHRERKELVADLSTLRCPTVFAFALESRDHPLSRYRIVLDPYLTPPTPYEPRTAANGLLRLGVFHGRINPLWEDPARFAQVLSTLAASTEPISRHRHGWSLVAADWPTRGQNLWRCIHPQCNAEQMLGEGVDPNYFV